MSGEQLQDVDLLMTTKGRMRVDALRQVPRWTVSESEIVLRIEYFLGEEFVRSDVHVCVLKGEAAIPQQATLGG